MEERSQFKKARVLLGKVGFDGHDRGLKIIAAVLREAGYEVIYLGKYLTVDSVIRAAIDEDVDAMGLSAMKMASGAGHDAQVMAGFTPSGLIFVPSVAGASHSPKEFSRWQDCVNGANALLQLALKLAKG